MTHKREHHTLPALYLKGFAGAKGEPFIWVYKKGLTFKPGKGLAKNYNPVRLPIRRASVIPYAYGYTKSDGTFDPDSYENRLEKLEKPSDLIFFKIRSRKMISLEEKSIFADYIFLTHKRVPLPEEQTRKKWKEFLDNWEELKAIRSSEGWRRLNESKRREVEEWLEKYKDEPNKQSLLEAMVQKSEPVNLYLRNMTWRFLIASGPSRFVTGDHPVGITGLGLRKLLSESTFPISSDITLHASWQKGKDCFCEIPERLVRQLNQRVATNSSQLFASRSEEWILRILNKGNYPINLLDFTGIMQELWTYRDVLSVPEEWLS